MQNKFKRHQRVKLLRSPDKEYIEYYEDEEEPIVAGMKGRINMMLPNGRYHVEIDNAQGEAIAYAMLSEEELESAEK